MIIGIAGPTASGKTTVADALERVYGAKRIRYSMILAEIAKEKGLDPDDKATLQELYLQGRKEHGEDFLAKELAERLRDSHENHIVIEGNRRRVDVPALRHIAAAKNDELKLVFIDASPDVRFARYNSRLEKLGDIPVSRTAFDALEQNEAEAELKDLRTIFQKEGLYVNTDALNAEATLKKVNEFLGL